MQTYGFRGILAANSGVKIQFGPVFAIIIRMMLNTLFLLMFTWLHPLHLSVSDLVVNPKTGGLEISHRIFLDDLEDALKEESGRSVDLSNPKNPQEVQALVGRYLQQHFKLILNGKPVKAHYLGYELEEDAIWAYMEVEKVGRLRTVEVQNTLFFNRYMDQLNLVHVSQKGETKSLRLDKKGSSGSLTF